MFNFNEIGKPTFCLSKQQQNWLDVVWINSENSFCFFINGKLLRINSLSGSSALKFVSQNYLDLMERTLWEVACSNLKVEAVDPCDPGRRIWFRRKWLNDVMFKIGRLTVQYSLDAQPNLTLSWRRPLSYRNQFIDLQSKSMDWFLYDNGLRHEIVKHPTSLRDSR